MMCLCERLFLKKNTLYLTDLGFQDVPVRKESHRAWPLFTLYFQCISYLMMFFCLYDNSFMYVVFLLLNGENANGWGMLIRISFSNFFCFVLKRCFCSIWFLVSNVWHYKMDVGELVGVLSCTMPSQWGPLRTIQAACGELVRWRESMTERQRQSDNSRGAGPVVLATSVFWATAVWVSPWPSPQSICPLQGWQGSLTYKWKAKSF